MILDALKVNEKLHLLSKNPGEIIEQSKQYIFLKPYPCWTLGYILERALGISRRLSSDTWTNNHTACGVTANAVMNLNVFNQKYYRSIGSIEKLYQELQDDERGCFRIAINFGRYLIETPVSNFYIPYIESLDHAFIIIKYINTDGSMHYQIIQSYVDTYTLQDSLQNKVIYFTNFEQLKQTILEPLFSFYPDGVPKDWNKFSKVWYDITGANLQQGPIRKTIKSDKFLEMKRTSDYRSIFDIEPKAWISILSTIIVITSIGTTVFNTLSKNYK